MKCGKYLLSTGKYAPRVKCRCSEAILPMNSMAQDMTDLEMHLTLRNMRRIQIFTYPQAELIYMTVN